MTHFQVLLDAIDLKKSGRLNAAKAQWNSLPPLVRHKVTLFLITILETKEPLEAEVHLRSKDHGDLVISDSIIADWKKHLPSLVLNG